MSDQVRPPEIINDRLSEIIKAAAMQPDVETILEIGSAAGTGSTASFVEGILANRRGQNLFCIELSKINFEELQKNMSGYPFVKCYNMSTVGPEELPSKEEVAYFYETVDGPLRHFTLDTVLGWLDWDFQYVNKAGVACNAIEHIKAENNVEFFDIVLIDGSEFSGEREFRKIDGSKMIILDDVMTFKCSKVRELLLNRHDYRLIAEELELRNGFSVFAKR